MKKKKNSKLFAWQEKSKMGGVCSKCNREEKLLTVDHIIPKYILEMLDRTGELATEWEDNFELMCKTCNSFKANRLDITHPKTKRLLQELINKL